MRSQHPSRISPNGVHFDFGHMTDDCIGPRREIGCLLSKGHFKELLGRNKSRVQDHEEIPQKAAPPPPNAQIINFISKGSDICGTLILLGETTCQRNQIGEWILVDGGSSMNIIQTDVHRKLNIPEIEITPRSSVLVGFSGETKNTLGDIKLPIYIEGVNFYQKFCVINNLSCCSMILGRPWIHEMKVVASTYHQCIKLPTPWGVVKIDSDQAEARNYYTSSMKPAMKQTIA
ncbi:uncharacterized protein LOC143608058 [Bidens hawaiensis]|uniref:uncharacterized protein LOC143608058 n=1 Tax=Bidens hawaiensis TaxID=980011 RepID=UPI00404B2AE9